MSDSASASRCGDLIFGSSGFERGHHLVVLLLQVFGQRTANQPLLSVGILREVVQQIGIQPIRHRVLSGEQLRFGGDEAHVGLELCLGNAFKKSCV